VSGVAVLDPSTTPSGELTLAYITRVFSERLHLLPPLRWRLVEVPLGLDHPYWLDDPEFDLEFHVRELRLPPPGNETQLAEQVARIVARPLDRARPLWESYLIGGLQDGHVALLTKVHHAVADGVSGGEIHGILFDRSPDERKIPQGNPHGRRDRRPRDIELLGRGIAALPRQPVRALRALPTTIPNLETVPTLRGLPGAGLAARAVDRFHRAARRDGDGLLLESPAARAPRTRFNARITPHRRVAFGSLSLPEIKAIKNANGATVNDVIVALCTVPRCVRDARARGHRL